MNTAKTQFLITETPYGQRVQKFRRKQITGIFNERGELTNHTWLSFCEFRRNYPEEAAKWTAREIWTLIPTA